MKIILSLLFVNFFAFAEISPKDQWKIISSSKHLKNKIVAIIDTGADLDHPMIKSHLWENPGEQGLDIQGRDKKINGIDDDKNGYIDDVHGWNFLEGNKNISDHHGHGTHVAGLIAHGESGFRWKSLQESAPQLMILKFYSEQATPQQVLKASVHAIEYATRMGAHIINYSGGGESKSISELFALYKAEQMNILVVAAAGNDHIDLDEHGFYPASYPLKNIIRVAALKDSQNLLEKSNYGKNTVDIAAPGYKIISAAPGNAFAEMSGTSQSTALISGMLARSWSQQPTLNANKMKEYLLKEQTKENNLSKKIRGDRVAVSLDL